jgi:chromosomal replication initiation ATPase DnaA
MKEKIFEYYANSIASQFNISLEEMFTQTKKSHIVDARQLLYFLCIERPIKISYLQSFLKYHGYIVTHSTIDYGYKQSKKLIESDPDFKKMILDIQKRLKTSLNDN